MDLRHPPAEVAVDAALVRGLLGSQHPDLLRGEVTFVAEGWDNFIYRVGSEYAVRLPRRRVAVDLLLNEQRWLPSIEARLPIAVPAPLAVGEPSEHFPWSWSVVRWIDGTTVEARSLSRADAELIASVLRVLHEPAPRDAPRNQFRGVLLQSRREAVEERMARLDLGELLPLWSASLGAEPCSESVWLHGDLHPKNVLMRDGALVGIIDWGDMSAGDPATDLACAWTLFEAGARSAFRRAYAPTLTEWTRARGWAVHFGAAMLDSGEPSHEEIGRRVLERVAAEP